MSVQVESKTGRSSLSSLGACLLEGESLDDVPKLLLYRRSITSRYDAASPWLADDNPPSDVRLESVMESWESSSCSLVSRRHLPEQMVSMQLYKQVQHYLRRARCASRSWICLRFLASLMCCQLSSQALS